jgi:hypothetical protein
VFTIQGPQAGRGSHERSSRQKASGCATVGERVPKMLSCQPSILSAITLGRFPKGYVQRLGVVAHPRTQQTEIRKIVLQRQPPGWVGGVSEQQTS